jgi:hypothetical protein
MSNTRYLEISSEYRDRNLYPLSAQFNVNISKTGTKSKENALDPVSNGAPILIFSNQFDANTAAALFVSGTVASTIAAPVGGIGNTTSSQKIIVTFAGGDPQLIDGFYNGAILFITTATTAEHRRILSYESISTTQGAFIVDSAFSNAVINTSPVDIAMPSDNNATTPKTFIPNGSDADNFYINYILEDVTLGEFRTITSYDGNTHLATINAAFGGGWAATDSFIVRRERPCSTGALTNAAAPTTTSTFLIPTIGVDITGDFIRMTSGANDTEIRHITKYIEPITGILVAGTTINQFVLPISFSTQNNFYNSFFINITSGAAIGDVRLITTYFMTTTNNLTVRTGTPNTPFTAGIAAGDTFRIDGGVVSPAMPNNFVAADTFEILCFTRDNAVPFNYTGNSAAQQEEACYEIELVNLTLPNEILSVGNGSRITQYPYVYVELANVSSTSSGTKGIIYSNNPHATKMLFRCAVTDTSNCIVSPFIKLDGNKTVQTIKWKINTDLKFSVRLPNGEVFQTIATENFSPLPPNSIDQVSALFSMRRLVNIK